MKKRRVRNAWDLAALPITPTKTTTGFETPSQARQRVRAEEAEAKRLAAEAERNKKLEQFAHDAAVRTLRMEVLFSEPSPELANLPQKPAAIEGATVESIANEIHESAEAAFADVRLSPSQKDAVVKVLAANPTLDTRSVEVWRHVRHLLESLNYGVDAAPVEQPVAQPVAKSEPTFDDVLNANSIESRSGNKVIRDAVGLGWKADQQKMFFEWIASLKQNFGYDFPVEKLAQKVGAYFVKWNLSPMRPESYDKVRRAFSFLGEFRAPDGSVLDLRTPEDILADQIESADLSNRDVKRDIALRTKELTRV